MLIFTVDGRDGFDRTRWIGRAVDFIAVGTDAQPTAKGRFRIAASAATSLDSQSARLRTVRPGRPISPLTVTGTVGHLVFVSEATLAAVARRRVVAHALAALALVALRTFTRVRAMRPFAPLAPSAIHCTTQCVYVCLCTRLTFMHNTFT